MESRVGYHLCADAAFEEGIECPVPKLVIGQHDAYAEQADVFYEIASLQGLPHPNIAYMHDWSFGSGNARSVHEGGDYD